MSTPTVKRPLQSSSDKRPSMNPPTSPAPSSRSPSRASTPTNTTPNGVQRTRSLRTNGTPLSARASVRKPGAPSSLSRSQSSQSQSQADDADDDAREEAAAALQDLKERLQKAEDEAAEKEKQVNVLNARLDDALKEQAKLEERAHEEEEKVEGLENEKRELTRQQRELESIYEAERAQTMKEKDHSQSKQEELQETIQRLKETLTVKDIRLSDGEEPGRLSRTSSFRNNSRSNSSQNLESSAQFAPPASVQRSNSRNNSKLIHQKDKIIEGLRLELAEVQIKLVEMENMGGGRMQELEKQLLETRMTNARLMEDNESFQLLLSEKTLNGDFSRGDFMRTTETAIEGERAPSRNGPSTSLADELESAEEMHTSDNIDAVRRVESEVTSLKDQNKALTLYINKIIERLLQHQGFESILQASDLEPAGKGTPNTDKDLPPPPPAKDDDQPSFLQRAKSVMGNGRKPRPQSMAPVTTSVNEDPSTAPSIPLGRSQSVRNSSGNYPHRRSTPEWPGGNNPNPAAAAVVNNMYRAPPPAAGQISPGLVSPRNSFFGIPIGVSPAPSGPNPTSNPPSLPASRVPSSGAPSQGKPLAPNSIDEDKISDEYETSTVKSDRDGASSSIGIDTPSPPRSNQGSVERPVGVMTGNKMRPLRLVEAEEEAVRARNKANRGSWIAGWFKGAGPGAQGQGEENSVPQ